MPRTKLRALCVLSIIPNIKARFSVPRTRRGYFTLNSSVLRSSHCPGTVVEGNVGTASSAIFAEGIRPVLTTFSVMNSSFPESSCKGTLVLDVDSAVPAGRLGKCQEALSW